MLSGDDNQRYLDACFVDGISCSRTRNMTTKESRVLICNSYCSQIHNGPLDHCILTVHPQVSRGATEVQFSGSLYPPFVVDLRHLPADNSLILFWKPSNDCNSWLEEDQPLCPLRNRNRLGS